MKECKYREQVENDLRCYLDWNIRIESVESIYGAIENLENAELIQIKTKVLSIKRVFDRLSNKNKNIIKGKYLYGYSREKLLKDNNISKNELYEILKRMIQVFEKEIYHSK